MFSKLARSPQDVNLLEIIETMDGDGAMMPLAPDYAI